MKALACFILVAVFSGASIVAQSTAQAPAAGTSSIDAAIKAVADAYTKATLAGDAKAIAALYTEDAVEMPPNQPSVKGRAAIQEYYEKQFAGTKITQLSLIHLETHGVGDRGYDVGTYQQHVAPSSGAGVDDTGKYVVILKRTGGAWKVAYAIYSSDRPMSSGTAR
jgi:uncharacterized protein (TIGR02246 family)